MAKVKYNNKINFIYLLISSLICLCCTSINSSLDIHTISKGESEIKLNNFNINKIVNNPKEIQNIIGYSDTVIYDLSSKEEFGFEIYDLIYGNSRVTIQDKKIVEIVIKDNNLYINDLSVGVEVGNVFSHFNNIEKYKENSYIYRVKDKDDTLIFVYDLVSEKIIEIWFIAATYY
jgi:hypothetical protein